MLTFLTRDFWKGSVMKRLLVVMVFLLGFVLAQEATTEERIANALSGGPAIISEGARVMDWPDRSNPKGPGVELIELR